MRRLSPLLLILMATCSWPMEPPHAVPPIRGFPAPYVPADGHGWSGTHMCYAGVPRREPGTGWVRTRARAPEVVA